MIGLSSKYEYLLREITNEKDLRSHWDEFLLKKYKEIENRYIALLDYLEIEEKEMKGITFVKKTK